MTAGNVLYYGDNLEVLGTRVPDASVDLCYIDPPFHSRRDYTQVHRHATGERASRSRAFIDTWSWDERAERDRAACAQTGAFLDGMERILGRTGLLAYLAGMAPRIEQIHRVLRPTGSLFLHCDPSASHYLKLLLDAVFLPPGGEFRNEIVWCYSQGGRSRGAFGRKHDIIFWYSKSAEYQFHGDAVRMPLTPHKQSRTGRNFGGRMGVDENGREYVEKWGTGRKKLYRYYLDEGKIPEDWWADINSIQSDANERLGYPTQKPEALLERILKAASSEGDTVLDAYCGCGTTVVAAQALGRRWMAVDIAWQSIATAQRRLHERFGVEAVVEGAPRNVREAVALARKDDERLDCEFEKWALLTYTNNRAAIDGRGATVQAASGTVALVAQARAADEAGLAQLRARMNGASRGVLIALEGALVDDDITVVTLADILERNARMQE